MTAITAQRTYTPEELLGLPDSVNYELVDGHLVQRDMGMESSEIAVRITFLLALFMQDRRLGRLFGADAGYQCFPDAPSMVRKPDASFIKAGRLVGGRAPTGHCPIPPDLAVEVVSPGDSAYEVEEKVAEYLSAGVPLVWVVYPTTRTVRVRRPQSSPLGIGSELGPTDSITGEDVLPGFSTPVSAFFE